MVNWILSSKQCRAAFTVGLMLMSQLTSVWIYTCLYKGDRSLQALQLGIFGLTTAAGHTVACS